MFLMTKTSDAAPVDDLLKINKFSTVCVNFWCNVTIKKGKVLISGLSGFFYQIFILVTTLGANKDLIETKETLIGNSCRIATKSFVPASKNG
jgi:hypothetical protein